MRKLLRIIMIEKVIRRKKLTEPDTDLRYWMSKTCEERIAALETIREEYNSWRYNAKQRFQRVYTITKRKQS